MKYVEPPFTLGETLTGTDSDGNLINGSWLGAIFEFPDVDPSISHRAQRGRNSARTIKAICLRNTSGVALLGKRIVQLEEDSSNPRDLLKNASGYADVYQHEQIAVVDEYLDSNGVADDDLFWGVVEGPVTILTANVNTQMNGDIAFMAPVVAATAAVTSGNSGAGRISNITAAATQGFTLATALIGYALTARTSNNTGSDVLVHTKIRY